MHWRRWAIGGAVLLGLAAVLAWAWRPPAQTVRTGNVQRGDWSQWLTEDGVLRVQERHTVLVPVSGRLLRPTVKVGDAVARGATVATIVASDTALLDTRARQEAGQRREAAAARHERAGVLQAQAAAALDLARKDQQRIDALARDGFVAATEREHAALALQAREREHAAAVLERDAALHELELARAAAASLPAGATAASAPRAVTAPISGRVLKLWQESGGPVSAGMPLLELGDTTRLEAVIDVLSEDAARLQVGATAQLQTGAPRPLDGRILRIEPTARTRVSALGIEEQRVDVIVALDDASLGVDGNRMLGDGYRVVAELRLAQKAAALQVPTAALLRERDGWAVFRVVDRRARLVPIELSGQGPEWSVVSAGLAEGDSVVLYPGEALRDGSRVR
jgi:HlyD family secretion protein